jgi:predicted alpha/beta-hydrolase family hydrolase
MNVQPRSINIESLDTTVSSLTLIPESAETLLVLAHGAGADMNHAFMEAMAALLADRSVATLRYQFPYSEKGRRSPDPARRLQATVRAVIDHARGQFPGFRLFAGGKSMGGRMTSLLAAENDLEGIAGLVFLGFPLHQAGKPDDARGAHLLEVPQPMLFLQGSRDRLADLELLTPLCSQIGKRAQLHVIEWADHSFHVPKKSGRSDNEILEELADVIADWTADG